MNTRLGWSGASKGLRVLSQDEQFSTAPPPRAKALAVSAEEREKRESTVVGWVAQSFQGLPTETPSVHQYYTAELFEDRYRSKYIHHKYGR